MGKHQRGVDGANVGWKDALMFKRRPRQRRQSRCPWPGRCIRRRTLERPATDPRTSG
jgi:hypothetical protein